MQKFDRRTLWEHGRGVGIFDGLVLVWDGVYITWKTKEEFGYVFFCGASLARRTRDGVSVGVAVSGSYPSLGRLGRQRPGKLHILDEESSIRNREQTEFFEYAKF